MHFCNKVSGWWKFFRSVSNPMSPPVCRTFQEPPASLTSMTLCLCPRSGTASCSSLAPTWRRETQSSARAFRTLETWSSRWFVRADKTLWIPHRMVVVPHPVVLINFNKLSVFTARGWLQVFYLFITFYTCGCKTLRFWMWRGKTPLTVKKTKKKHIYNI